MANLPLAYYAGIKVPDDVSPKILRELSFALTELSNRFGVQVVLTEEARFAQYHQQLNRWDTLVEKKMRVLTRRFVRQERNRRIKGLAKAEQKHAWPYKPWSTDISFVGGADRIRAVLEMIGCEGEFEKIRKQAMKFVQRPKPPPGFGLSQR